jgi:PAS domain S-box-containing protein
MLSALLDTTEITVVQRRRTGDQWPVVAVSAAVQCFGYHPEALPAWETLVHPDDLPTYRAVLAAADRRVALAYRLRAADGTWRRVREQGMRTPDGCDTLLLDDCPPPQFPEVDPLFLQLADVNPAGVFVAQDEHFVYVNDAAAAMTGYTREELLGLHFSAVVHPEFRPLLQRFASQRLAGYAAPPRYELRVLHKSGAERWADFSPQAISYNGRPAIQAVVVDITERKHAREALRESEATLRAVLDSVHEAIFVLDREGIIHLANADFAQRFNTTPEALRGTYAYDLLPPDLAQARRRKIMQVFATGQAVEFEDSRQGCTILNRIYPVKCGDEVQRVVVMGLDITEYNALQQAMLESVGKFRAVAEQSPVSIAVVQDERFVYVNDAVMRQTGYSREELLTMDYLTMVQPEDRQHLAYFAARRLAGASAPERYTLLLRMKNGTERWVDISPRLLTYAGRPAIMLVMLDITDHHEAELALRASEARLLQAERMAHLGHWQVSLLEGVVSGSEETFRIIGLPWEPITVDQLLAMLHPDDMPIMRQRFANPAQADLSRPIEYRIIRPDGEMRYIRTTSQLEHDAAGQPMKSFGVVQDVTTEHQAQEQISRLLSIAELRGNELEAIISSIADGVIIYGPQCEILQSNQAVLTFMPALWEFRNLPVAERLPRYRIESPDGTLADLTRYPPLRALQGETVHGEVYLFPGADGTHKWASMSAAPLKDPDGGIRGAVVSLTDITPLRALQQQQEEMLHLVSHDLRIPLTVISGHLELLALALEEQGLADCVAEHTDTIARNAQRLQVMIGDLVEVAGLEGRQFTLQPVPLMLQRFVPELLCRVRGALPVARVCAVLPDDLPPVSADPDRLERVVLNLLSNACKYSAVDAPVQLRAWHADGRVHLAVCDEGRGIAPQDVPHIFDRFYRARGERKAEGIGLGLYITRLLVEAHGGTVGVESTPGVGSTFTVTLPAG